MANGGNIKLSMVTIALLFLRLNAWATPNPRALGSFHFISFMSFCTICASSSLAPRIAPNLITLNSAIAACDKAGQWEVALSLPLDYFGSGPGIWGSLIKLALSGSSFMRFWFIYIILQWFLYVFIYTVIYFLFVRLALTVANWLFTNQKLVSFPCDHPACLILSGHEWQEHKCVHHSSWVQFDETYWHIIETFSYVLHTSLHLRGSGNHDSTN